MKRFTVKRPTTVVVGLHKRYVTVTEVAAAVVDDKYVVSPLYAAVSDTVPAVRSVSEGVQEHVAVFDDTVTAPQPLMSVPPFLNATVPVAPEVTVATKLYAVATRAVVGADVRVTVDEPNVDADAVAEFGALVTLGYTAATRNS